MEPGQFIEWGYAKAALSPARFCTLLRPESAPYRALSVWYFATFNTTF